MKTNFRFLLIFLFSMLLVTSIYASDLLVVLPGTIQSALGGKDWNPDSEITKMTLVKDNIYEFKGIFPAGNYEYKVAIGGNWDENYGLDGKPGGGNIKLAVPEDNYEITITFDYNTKLLSDTINGIGVSNATVDIEKIPKEKSKVEIDKTINASSSLQIRLPGTIQSILGGNEWDPADDITLMSYKGNDIYEFIGIFPKGNYEYKVAIGGTWDENYGQDGTADGSNISLTVPSDDTEVKFIFDFKNKTIKHELEVKGFNYIPILTNTIERKGEDADYNITNEFDFGIISKNLVLNSKTSFNFDLYNNNYSIIKNSIEEDNLSIKDLELEELTLDYTNNDITYGLMINKSKYSPSKDYFGILDASTETDDRDNTKNPEDISDKNIAIKLSTNKFASIDIAASRYTSKLLEKGKSQKNFGKIDIEKTFFNNVLKLGSANIFYGVTNEGVSEDTAINSTLYTEISLLDNLAFKGEIGYIPTGSIFESNGNTGTFKQANGKWLFKFDPEDYDINVTKEVHIVGEFQNWNPSDKSYALTKNSDGIWTGEFDIVEGTGYKFIYDSNSWNGNEKGLPANSGSNAIVEEISTESEGLDYGLNMYLAELNYNILDKGALKFGTKSLAANVYMPFAKDDILDDNETGYVEYYLDGNYKILNNLKLTLKKVYKTQEVNKDLILENEFKIGFDIWNIPFFKYIKGSTTQKTESDQYYLETEIKNYSSYIDHIKGNLTYAIDDINFSDEDGKALQYWTEIKLHNLPSINKFIPYILINYESDDNGNDGIVENEDYYDKDDNDNDWLQKLYIESKFNIDSIKNWNGIKISYETRKIEESKTNYDQAIEEDGQYYVSAKRTFVDWYSFFSLNTEYLLPYGVKTKLTYKYDLDHEKISEWEDDGLKIEVEKKIGITTINVSYNKQDSDEGDDYLKINFKSVF